MSAQCCAIYCSVSSFVGVLFLKSVIGAMVDKNSIFITKKIDIETEDQRNTTVQNIFITVGIYAGVFVLSTVAYVVMIKRGDVNQSLIERRNDSNYSRDQQELVKKH